MNRRNFIRTAAGLLVAAPMVVRASSLMPVKAPKVAGMFAGTIGYYEGFFILYSGDHALDAMRYSTPSRLATMPGGDTFVMIHPKAELISIDEYLSRV